MASKGPRRNIFYVAPTRDQAKEIMWPVLEELGEGLIVDQDASRLKKIFRNGSVVRLYGAQKFDRGRGQGFHDGVFEETQDIPQDAWKKVFRPALSNHRGGCLFIGTPKGRGNWLYDLNAEAVNRRGWSRHHYTTIEGGWVDDEEIDDARSELDERTFRQEYEASFEDYGGLVYYKFDDVLSVVERAFEPDQRTVLAWDFNAGERPMSVVALQFDGIAWYAVKEWCYPNTNTEEMCQAIERTLVDIGFRGTLEITGDHYGTRRESNASRSDYLIIESFFKNRPGYKVRIRPTIAIQDRVAATNSLLCNQKGERRLLICRQCKGLIKAFQRVTWKENGQGLQEVTIGEIDVTDAISYFPYNHYPVDKKKSVVTTT